VALLSPLTPDQRTTFLVVSLAPKALSKLVGRLGTAAPGTRLETMSVWDLAWSLIDYYEDDAEVARAVDRTLERDLGEPPLLAAVRSDGGAEAVSNLVLSSRDPARDLAWALLAAATPASGPLAADLVQTIVKDFDEADERAKAAEAEAEVPDEAPAETEAERLAREKEKEALQAQRARERALKRVDTMKDRLVELEGGVATARREVRAAEEARERLEAERDRLARERDALRAQLQAGTAGEVTRLTTELETARRRLRSLEGELEEARESESALSARLRAQADERPARAVADDVARTPAPTAAWSMPIFTDEFYESIRRWDRKVVRNAFEKIYRLAEDWRHPSLRAIPLEGLPGCYRIRVATDVRLIYRPLDGNRVEVMSLIDREDLQRYIRQAKTRAGIS
jgi:chemotaxis protein histidine kinase CheA